jgi:RES domain-containing protein
LLQIKVPDDLRVDHISLHELPKDWPEDVEQTRGIGDAWLAKASTAMLRVPSVLVPETFNVLLNPAHPDASRVAIVKVTEHVIDPRLLK